MWPGAVPIQQTKDGAVEVRVSAVAATVQAPWWEKFSILSRLVRVLFCVLKWRYKKESSADRLVRAKAVLCRIVQRYVFCDGYASLSAHEVRRP